MDFDVINVKYGVIEGAEDDDDNGFALVQVSRSLAIALWPSLAMLDFDDGEVKYRVIDHAKDDGDIGFAFGLGFGHDAYVNCYGLEGLFWIMWNIPHIDFCPPYE